MATTTRWKFNLDISIDDIQNKMISHNNQEIEFGSSSRLTNIEVTKGLEENQDETIGDRLFTYNYLTLKYDLHTTGPDSILYNHFLVVFSDGRHSYVIIEKNSGAKQLLRSLMGYDGRGEITKISNNITSNKIIWLISRVYLEDSIYTEKDFDLEIDAIIGFRGNTEDEISKVSADGDSVMNILSTLSFLLESSSLKQVKLRLSYGNHTNIEIKIDVNDSINFYFRDYRGKYKTGNDYRDLNDDHKKSLSLLLVYCEIIPIINQWYDEYIEIDDENNSLWNENAYRDFLEIVANDLTEKIESKKNILISNNRASVS